ncbi:formyltransferase family protein [Aliikangiella sp. IMCC44359]|uniref:formyltransferase family protein n=1 Tax=Aliikangiella sp. IMCC44359 TaxID=3459125 RepID=UPI00403B2F9D
MKAAIAVFAYDFPHRKTNDFLSALYLNQYKNVIVLAAPKKTLSTQNEKNLINPISLGSKVFDTKDLCQKYGFEYLRVEHDNVSVIQETVLSNKVETAIISGARIIKKDIIKLFVNGIINFHPGKTPETSGLDSFYWMLNSRTVPGITVHFIDHKVDAGKMIKFDEILVSNDDTPATIQLKIYQQQIRSLYQLLLIELPASDNCSNIERPFKNEPMINIEKSYSLLNFDKWKQNIISLQSKAKLFEACELGLCELIPEIDCGHHFINSSNEKGWSPLVIAAFYNQLTVVKYLISNGANVNHVAKKGTSVLMYAKSSQLNKEVKDYSVLDYLISAGANIMHKDVFSKTVIDYVVEAKDFELVSYFKSKLEK